MPAEGKYPRSLNQSGKSNALRNPNGCSTLQPFTNGYEPTGRAMWRNEAACKGMSTEIFYPEQGNPKHWGNVRLARETCESCPVSSECLEEAVVTRELFGFWGGKSVKQRRPIRKQWKESTWKPQAV